MQSQYSQVSQAQNTNQVELQLPLHLQRPDDGDWEGRKKDVCEDVEGRVDQREGDEETEVVALGLECFVPVALHREAVKHEGHHSHEGVAADKHWPSWLDVANGAARGTQAVPIVAQSDQRNHLWVLSRRRLKAIEILRKPSAQVAEIID